MIKQAFLTREEIKALQAQEAASTKEQKRTPEQIDAIYSSGTNILVSASAGSGKTFVMVQRILDQMQRGISIKELFISTFTVKAAGELKERLESELGKALQASDDPEQKRTPEQIDAIYSSGTNILVSASAGSGKTFVMVQRILDQMPRCI